MREEKKEIIKLTSIKLLMTLVEAAEKTARPFFESSRIYRQPIRKYLADDRYDKTKINDRIQYLKKIGAIKIVIENKEKFVEISPIGFKKLKEFSSKIEIPRPEKWDKMWRIVIFDIKEKLRSSRDSLRLKLKNLGFIKIQKSVYIFPFPCTEEISTLSKSLGVEKSVTIFIAEIIQGEKEIIYKFMKNRTLNKKDL
ncbi:MAG: CRISPR-associated endonuclease Cas2 [Candidatus Berkelbacteria bacterium]|nr:CRISPR-associated endonuclease Cas2 [Candidatus Berkelbacteria bacterium]